MLSENECAGIWGIKNFLLRRSTSDVPHTAIVAKAAQCRLKFPTPSAATTKPIDFTILGQRYLEPGFAACPAVRATQNNRAHITSNVQSQQKLRFFPKEPAESALRIAPSKTAPIYLCGKSLRQRQRKHRCFPKGTSAGYHTPSR